MADFCPCCHYPHEGQLFSLLCESRDLAELGEGFPLYFDLAKWLNVLLLLVLGIAGSYSLYCHYAEDNVSDSSLSSNWIMRGSLGIIYLASYGDHSPSVLEPILHMGAVIVLLMLHSYLVYQHEIMEDELDRNTVTPSDYTIQVTNLPRTDLHTQDLVDFLATGSRPDGKPCRIVKVNLAYQISPFLEACRHLSEVKERLAELRLLQSQDRDSRKKVLCIPCKSESVEQYEVMAQDHKAIVAQLEADVTQQFTGIAFVTYAEDENAKAAKSTFRKAKTDCRSLLCPFLSSPERSSYRGQQLILKSAPDPSDLIWENLGVRSNLGIQVESARQESHNRHRYCTGPLRRSCSCLLLFLHQGNVYTEPNCRALQKPGQSFHWHNSGLQHSLISAFCDCRHYERRAHCYYLALRAPFPLSNYHGYAGGCSSQSHPCDGH